MDEECAESGQAVTIDEPPGNLDRMESIKAGSLTGLVSGLVAATLLLTHRVLALSWQPALASVSSGLSGVTFWVSITIAILSGSLFGITYRYAVRLDTNFQIKTGVVLAFSLVRGLALVNVAAAISLNGWPFLFATLESLIVFAIAASMLELTFHRGWIQKAEG